MSSTVDPNICGRKSGLHIVKFITENPLGRIRVAYCFPMNRDSVLRAQIDVSECSDDQAGDMLKRVLPSDFHLVEDQLWYGEAYLLTLARS